MMPIAVGVIAAAVLWLASRWVRARRGRRRRAQAVRRLEVSIESWYRAARSFESDATGYAFQLRSFGAAALGCAKELATLDDGHSRVREWDGPPFKPVALERAGRPGPDELWRRFDHAFENVWRLAHPFDHCLELGEATIALADWIDTNRPLIHPPEKHEAPEKHENAGVDAGFIHAASAPCLASLAAESTVREEGWLQLDCEALAQRVHEDGTDAQRTMLAVAAMLTAGGQRGGPTIGELLALEDTDLCHALEAIALARRLRRVYPAQRPELLWMQAALAESDDDHGA